MIKFILQRTKYYRGDYETVTINSDDNCPLEGAVLEEWVETQTLRVPARFNYYQEARLDEDGKPFIYSEKSFTPQYDMQTWKKQGIDHASEKIEPEGEDPYWIYSRKAKQTAWTFTAETLEQIEEFLDKEYDMGVLYIPINGIKYYLTID